MRVSADEQQLCPCYEECQEFQKLVELKNSGLVIYCHRPRKEDIRQAEAVESAENTSRDAFILYNKKDVKITTSELTSELETKNISCPRCRKKYEHAQQLMQEVKSIDRMIVLGICDHCRKKATTKTITTAKPMKKPFCACKEIVKKFINVKGEQKEEIKKYVKLWLSKMGHLLKDDITPKKTKQIETRAYSDLQINRGLNSPASLHEPEIQQMFYSGMHKSDINLSTEMRETNLKEGHMKQAVAFFQPIEHVETTFAHTPHDSEKINAMIPSTLLENSDTTLVKTYTKELPKTSLKDRIKEEVFQDIPSMDAKEALKRRHDLSLRQMMRLEKESRVPYYVSKRPDIYETPKITPWPQKDPTLKYQEESEMDSIMPTPKQYRFPREIRDLDYESNREVKFKSTRPSQDSYYDTKIDDKFRRLRDSEEGLKTVKKLKDHYITNEELKLHRSLGKISHKPKKSDQDVAKSKRWHKKGFDLKPEYSFFFPKVMKKEEKPVTIDVSSSHLINDTQEKFRLQAESDKKRREEERQQKLARDQKKKLAREEKKLQNEEKKRQAVEDKKYAEDKKRQQDKVKRDTTKKDTFDEDGESEQKRNISKESGVAKKEKKSDHEQGDKIDKVLQKAKKDLESKPEKEDKIAELLRKAKKDLDSKPEKEDKIAELLQKAKKDLDSKPEKEDKIANLLQKAKKDLESKPEKEDKIAELLQKAKKDLKPKPEREDNIAETKKESKPEKTKKDVMGKSELKEKRDDEIIENEKKDLKEKPTQKSKDDDLISKAMKDQKKKREAKDKDDETTEKDKKVLKGKPESIEKGSKDLKSGIEQKDKINVPEKDLKAKSQQNGKVVKKEQNIKTEKELQDEKLKREQENKDYKERLKQIEQLRKEKEALKLQVDKERKELSKETKSTKKKRDSSKEIKVSISKIQKSLKAKSQQNGKVVKKEQNIKTEKELQDEKLKREQENKDYKERLKQIEQLRKEKEALKLQADKERKELSKETKSTKKKRDSSQEIKVSISKIQKSLKAKSQQNGKVVKKEQNIKTEKELQDEKLKREQENKDYKERLKQIEQLRKEKEALKLQADKEKKELSKETMSTKKKRDSSKEIKVSISKIQKSLNKGGKDESGNKQDFSVKKKEEKKEKGKTKELIVKEPMQGIEFKKLQAAHLKEKEEALIKKKQLEFEAKVAKAKEEAGLKVKIGGLKLADINIQSGFSEDGLILKLIRIKQAATLKPAEIDVALVRDHNVCHHATRRSLCPLCLNSELELDVLSLDNKINLPKETDIVIGEKIFKIKRRLEKTKEPEVDPILHQKIFFAESDLPPREIVQLIPQEAEPVQKKILSKKDLKEIEMEPGKGVLRYALSDRTFIDKGWTMLPTEKVVRKMNVYRMRPAHPEFDWFEHNKNKRLMTYDTGERLAEFDDNGRGRWYYRSGRLALDYYDAEETNAQQRFVIYSSGEPDERGRTHPITILATFDYLGNGIVFDHSGKIRLKYNQTEGVVLDRGIGPVSHWKWHTLNDPPVLQQVMIDTQMAHKDPFILKLGSPADMATRPDNEEMLAIEFDNFIKEKSKKLSQKFKPFQIKMKALKINEHFSLKVLDQATVYLIFRDGSTNLKLNIGMILDHQEIVDTDTAEVGEVSNSLERFPARTDSLAGLQRSVAYAQRYERRQIERERRLRPAEPCASADQLTAAASPPMRLPFRTVPTASSTITGYCSRKPTNNLYYNTRLL